LIKLVFFDLDGTIIKPHYEHDRYKHLKAAPSLWTKIAEHLGEDALEEEETKRKWTRGEGFQGNSSLHRHKKL